MDSPGHCHPMLQHIIKHPIGISITHPLVLYSGYLLSQKTMPIVFSGCTQLLPDAFSISCHFVESSVKLSQPRSSVNYQIPYTPHSDLSRSAPIILSCAQESQLQLLQLLTRAVYSFFHASPSVSSYSMLLALGI